MLLGGTDPAAARALIEHGANARPVKPIRVEAARLTGVDLIDVEECAPSARADARLTGAPIVIDLVEIGRRGSRRRLAAPVPEDAGRHGRHDCADRHDEGARRPAARIRAVRADR